MSTEYIEISAGASGNKPCGCGCGCTGCKAGRCSLDCITRPRFFCGQLLADQDLTALVSWTEDKLKLARFRHGWGVVCGLDVRCDPGNCGQLIIGPGYAMSCCGDDIVVCKDTPVDLTGLCKPANDPCADLRRSTGDEAAKAVQIGGAYVPEKDLRIVDLVIGYSEQPSDPVTAFNRGASTPSSTCDYSRTLEQFMVTPVVGRNLSTADVKWVEAYDGCMSILASFRANFADLNGKGAEAKAWLLRQIDANPPHQFCWIRNRVCNLTDLESESFAVYYELLFWLIQDCRNALVACDCFSCSDDDAGVPIARVWLQAPSDGSTCCAVIAIDQHPPYRRNTGATCWPAKSGCINAGQTIWMRQEDACVKFRELGIPVKEWRQLTEFGELERALACRPIVCCGDDPVTVFVYNAPGLGSRVIGICGSSAAQTQTDTTTTTTDDSTTSTTTEGQRTPEPPPVEQPPVDKTPRRARPAAPGVDPTGGTA